MSSPRKMLRNVDPDNLERRSVPKPGPHIRLIPHYLGAPYIVESRRWEDDAHFVHLDQVYDVKLFGFADVCERGPGLVVSSDFAETWSSTGYAGLEFLPAPHATPLHPRVKWPQLCRPTQYAPELASGVSVHPERHPRGRDYGYHGLPSDPFGVRVPAIPTDTAFGGPWLATASLPFQPLLVPSEFIRVFVDRNGRLPDCGWAEVELVVDPVAPMRVRSERFSTDRSTVLSWPDGEAGAPSSFDAELSFSLEERERRGHHYQGASERPLCMKEASWDAVWQTLKRLAGSVFYHGAFGFYPACKRDLTNVSSAELSAKNIPTHETLDEVNAGHEELRGIGYPIADEERVVGWFSGEFPPLLCARRSGEIVRHEAAAQTNLRYPSLAQVFTDVMADQDWAFDAGLYESQWFGK